MFFCTHYIINKFETSESFTFMRTIWAFNRVRSIRCHYRHKNIFKSKEILMRISGNRFEDSFMRATRVIQHSSAEKCTDTCPASLVQLRENILSFVFLLACRNKSKPTNLFWSKYICTFSKFIKKKKKRELIRLNVFFLKNNVLNIWQFNTHDKLKLLGRILSTCFLMFLTKSESNRIKVPRERPIWRYKTILPEPKFKDQI